MPLYLFNAPSNISYYCMSKWRRSAPCDAQPVRNVRQHSLGSSLGASFPSYPAVEMVHLSLVPTSGVSCEVS
eukprot:IDg1734t1